MSRALPPVGWQSIIEQDPQSTVVCAWLNTVVMLKQPGHFTSMKNELGDCTSRLSLCFRFSSVAEGWSRSRTMVEMPAEGTQTLRCAREGGGRGCPLVWGPAAARREASRADLGGPAE